MALARLVCIILRGLVLYVCVRFQALERLYARTIVMCPYILNRNAVEFV